MNRFTWVREVKNNESVSVDTLGVSLSMSIFYLIGVPSGARAQAVAIAEVDGTVADPTGATVPAAQVTMTATDKNQVRSTTTTSTGRYTFRIAGRSVSTGSEGSRVWTTCKRALCFR